MASRLMHDCCFRVALFCLEFVDLLQLTMEPFFKWLPILGLLYVLVPYYNQIQDEGDPWDDDQDDYDSPPDYDAFQWDRRR